MDLLMHHAADMELQWGRGHSTAETAWQWSIPTARRGLQWGRGHSTAETPHLYRTHRPPSRFNGAAVIQPRKRSSIPGVARGHPALQWGRGHSTAETRAISSESSGDSSRLQWGRGHSTAETTVNSKLLRVTEELQWGRGHSTAETTDLANGTVLARVLQWGRGHSTAETIVDLGQELYEAVASMGPRSFNRGNRDRGR